ncbi:hypothetical protein M2451_003323 [Dysgonomonas sp. PFB1-18]|uniref:hypothetical protein n=1 Tax=unclassified Dysgonomonas TaxID=2630389 RepID=UPI002476E163|nr:MULTISPECIES: hypothetical protein [unclassified Dysgonomonas]MDH6310587.1 hypothetical protein [Dysgonomonas sp. PF1-14]MDH6340437.1 hypothetical protein [Dysgonomonas sp. PF1-16]MDH6381983.1 hypothetical protein [Dysgonomonas sp. PFB1-18]MDH6399408.1 hypothetical protein [Dysgonomonas sp. PF1-23]
MKQKHVIALLCAIVFNVLSASAVSVVSGLPFAGVLGASGLLSLFGGTATGALNMGLSVEIWHKAIIGNLFADNSFLSKAFNADEYVTGSLVHIPNAGRPSKTEKNRTTVPAAAKKREDKDVEYKMNEFTTDPIYIPNIETVELSYNKRESAISEDRAVLHETVANDVLLSWSPTKTTSILKTSGSAVASYLNGSTGFRKALTVADVFRVMTVFNDKNVPQEGRYALLDAHMYSQLLNSMTDKDATAFHAAADVKNGVVGKLATFNFMLRSKSLIYKADGTPLEWLVDDEDDPQTFDPTDNAGALFWYEKYVCRSVGEIKAFGSEDNPLYYGDIYSFLLRAGGTIMRADGKGVIALVQDTAEEGFVGTSTFSTQGLDINSGQPVSAQTLELLVTSLSDLAETNAAQQAFLAEFKAELDELKAATSTEAVSTASAPVNDAGTHLTQAAIKRLSRSALEAFIADNNLVIEITEGMTNAQLADAIIATLGEGYFSEPVTE